MTICRVILASLVILAGLLALSIGNVFALPLAGVGMGLAPMLAKTKGRWFTPVSVLFAVAIFLTGSPLTGGRPDGLLLTAALACFFWAWTQSWPRPISPSAKAVIGAPIHEHAFTVTFYASLFLAFLLLRQRLFDLPILAAIFLGVMALLLGLAVWELSRRSRHGRAEQLEAATKPDRWARVFALLAILMAVFFLFRLPLPWMADQALTAMAKADLVYPPKREAPKPKVPEGESPKAEAQRKAMEEMAKNGAGQSKEDPATLWPEPGELPYRAAIRHFNVPEICLRIHDADVAKRYIERPLYVRSLALGVFRDGQWRKVDFEGDWIADAEDGAQDGWTALTATGAQPIRHTLFHLGYHRDELPLIQNATRLMLPKVMRSHGDAYRADATGYFECVAESSPVDFDLLGGLNLRAARGELHLLNVDDANLAKLVDEELVKPLGEEKDLAKKLASLRERLRERYQYSFDVANPQMLAPMTNFLAHERKGYCDFFATAGALAARRLGVPARVASGFAGGQYDQARNLFVFLDSHRHSWTEVQLDGQGWVIFETTPPAQGAARGAEAIANAPADPRDLLKKEEEPKVAEEPKVEVKEVPRRWTWRAVFDLIVHYLDWLLAALAVVLGIAYLWRRAAEKKKDEAEGSGAEFGEPQPEYFDEFCAALAGAGHPRGRGQTLREYCRALRAKRLIGDQFLPMVRYHYGVRYEDQARDKGQEKGFQRLVRELSESLREREERSRAEKSRPGPAR